MALLKYGVIVAEARGKLNGVVFSRNQYGAYARNKTTPANPNTTRQQEVRNALSSAAAAWRDLTSAQRAGWRSLADQDNRRNIFGDAAPLSGFNLYVSVNTNLLNLGQAQIADAPPQAAPQQLTAFEISNVNAFPSFIVAGAPGFLTTEEMGILAATPPLSHGISFPGSAYRVISTVVPTGTFNANFGTAYAAVFGNPIAGARYFAKAYIINITSGIASVPLVASFDT